MTKHTRPAPRAKLTEHELALIAELYENGHDYRAIAKKFGVEHEKVEELLGC